MLEEWAEVKSQQVLQNMQAKGDLNPSGKELGQVNTIL